jgi:hypothetical protein
MMRLKHGASSMPGPALPGEEKKKNTKLEAHELNLLLGSSTRN